MHITKIATLSMFTLLAACAVEPGEEAPTSVVEVQTENGAEAHIIDEASGETLEVVIWEGENLTYIDQEGHAIDLEGAMIRNDNFCWDACSVYLDGRVVGAGMKEHRACMWRCNGLM